MSWLDSYGELKGVRLNMVSNSVGEFIGSAGSSREISNELDRSLILKLRSLADVYVTGGTTFRHEHYAVPNIGHLAVITADEKKLPPRVIAITPPASENLATFAIEYLSNFHFERVLLEVGPRLARLFLKEDLVDEFCLTMTSGTISDAEKVVRSLESGLNLAESQTVESTLFTRWRRGNENH